MDNLNFHQITQLKKAFPVGESYNLIGLPASGDFVPVGDSILRANYPEMNVTYPEIKSIDVFTRVLPMYGQWGWVAEGNGVIIIMGNGIGSCARSTDGGLTWTDSPVPLPQNNGLVFGNGVFMTISKMGGQRYCCTSTDGLSWSYIDMETTVDFISIAYGNGKFIAATLNNNVVGISSDNGLTWTLQSIGTLMMMLYIVYNPDANVFVIGGSGGTIVSFDEGITWYLNYFDTALKLAYTNGVYITVRGNQNVYKSLDNFTHVSPVAVDGSGWNCIAAGDGLFMLCRGDKGAISQDLGITWDTFDIPSITIGNVGYCGNGKFIIVGTDGNAISVRLNNSQPVIELTGIPGSYVRIR